MIIQYITPYTYYQYRQSILHMHRHFYITCKLSMVTLVVPVNSGTVLLVVHCNCTLLLNTAPCLKGYINVVCDSSC